MHKPVHSDTLLALHTGGVGGVWVGINSGLAFLLRKITKKDLCQPGSST